MDLSESIGLARALVYSNWMPHWEREEALGDALLALVKAAKSFQPDRGVLFSTYASHRIRGEIIDGLRRRNGKRGRNEKFRPHPVVPLKHIEEFAGQKSYFEAIFIDDQRRQLVRAINRLADRDRMIITLYFFEGMTLLKIGELYGFSESRACQIVRTATEQLKRVLS